MAGDAAAKQLSHLPNSMLRFTVEKASETVGCRLGALSFPGRSTIKLPNFIGNTSRGTVPHLTQDNLRKNTSLQGLYVALEDCKWFTWFSLNFCCKKSNLSFELESHRTSSTEDTIDIRV